MKKTKKAPKRVVRIFRVEATCNFELKIDEEVIKQGCAPDDPIFGGDASPKMVAEHIAFNMIVNGLSLPDIDGFANRRDSEAVAVDLDDGWVIEAEEED